MMSRIVGISMFVVALSAPTLGLGQSLTLDDALKMARERNGIIRSAMADLSLSKSRVSQSRGTFLPEITPIVRYDNSRIDREGILSRTDETSTQLQMSWRLLDAGQRSFSLKASERLAESSQADLVQTMREVLFSVQEQYFNALRSQEQMKVFTASVERAQEIVKLTQAQIENKLAPAKDILQAESDYLNAKVDLLQAKNSVSTAQASLKATIGWSEPGRSVELTPMPALGGGAQVGSLDEITKAGLASRQDLRSRRFGIEAQKFNVRIAERNAGISWSVDANYTRQFSESELDNRNLTILASVPLFDGNQSKEQVNQAKLNLASLSASYLQAERNAVAEIESAYLAYIQNWERQEAASAALVAARKNFEAASEAQRLGAEGTNIITVLTAKISLVTAESNWIDAVYDVYIADARLRLVTGQPMPGESS